jgi:hypothetical protein
MSFSTKILVELVSGVLLGLFSTSMRPCSRWRRMGSSSTAPTGGGRGGGADWYPFLELGQAPRARVCAGYGHLSLLPMRLAPYYCCYYPGVGHHAHPASLQAGLRPTSSCPCPCSPSNVRLGCLSLRRRAWSRRRCARSGGVSHPFERVESPLKSSPPPAAMPVQTVRHRAPPGCRPRRRAGAARGAARQRPGGGGAGGGGCWGERGGAGEAAQKGL